MKKGKLIAGAVCAFLVIGISKADTFGTGGNQFTIDFVPISGDTGDLGRWSADWLGAYTFSGVNHDDYRMGTYEISNDQWTRFTNEYGTVTGSPYDAYNANHVSWYEAAQFVNWLNTSTGHTAAYKFTGTQGTGDYTFGVWNASDAWGGTNLYRHKDAFYFLPTEDEWVKAAYWNGTNLQTWAKINDTQPVSGVDSRYESGSPWAVGSGSKELNGTYDMMGNLGEWMESPYVSGQYSPLPVYRGIRGGSYGSYDDYLSSSRRGFDHPFGNSYTGFRVASVPEPATMVLLVFGAAILRRKRA